MEQQTSGTIEQDDKREEGRDMTETSSESAEAELSETSGVGKSAGNIANVTEAAGEGSLAERYKAMQEKFDAHLAELNDLKKKDRTLVYEWYSLRDGRRLRILIMIAIFCVGLTTGSWLYSIF